MFVIFFKKNYYKENTKFRLKYFNVKGKKLKFELIKDIP